MRFSSLRWHWNTLGRRDPLSAILTRGDEQATWDLDAFFETGRSDVRRFMAHADRLVPHLRKQRALDFGCGIGRLTRALADQFAEVIGVDVADSMIAAANAHRGALGNCRFEVNGTPDLRRFPDATFDFVLAWIVLQHMKPDLMRAYLFELVRVLAPGGLLCFQLPADVSDPRKAFCEAPVVGGSLKRSLPRPLVRAYRGVKFEVYRRLVPHMEMHALSREAVVRVIERAGGVVQDVCPDQSHGAATLGFSYWVTR